MNGMPKTTADLVEIIEQEFARSCDVIRVSSPVTNFRKQGYTEFWQEKWDLDVLCWTGAVDSFWDVRKAVQSYQVSQGISGIVSDALEVEGKRCDFPGLHDQLIMVDGDIDILRSPNNSVVVGIEMPQDLDPERSHNK